MALHEIKFTVTPKGVFESIPSDWSHSGVVGSGDMEVLISRQDNGGAVNVKIVTPIAGYDDIWERVLNKFVDDSCLGDVSIEINDNNSTPFVASSRLRQSLLEAKEGAGI